MAAVAFVPLLKLRQTRKIVFITSILGSIAAHHKTMFDEKRKSSHVGYLPYSASKVTIHLLNTQLCARQQQFQASTFNRITSSTLVILTKADAPLQAALNMVTTIIANQLQPEGFTVIALHPGAHQDCMC